MPKRKTDRVVIDSQARGIISKVYEFMKKEATANHAERLTDARWRTAKAIGVSERTITKILRDRDENRLLLIKEKEEQIELEQSTSAAVESTE